MEDRRCHKYKHIQEEAKASYHNRSKKPNHNYKPSKKLEYLSVKPTIWDDIILEDREFENCIRKENMRNQPAFNCTSGYLQRELFPQLIPAFEMICAITLTKCAHCQCVRFFNFIDALAEYLYNTNQRFKERKNNWKSIYQIYDNKERTFYPYFLFLTPDEAAIMIQALVRGFLVRRKIYSKAMKEGSLETLDKNSQKDL